MRTFFTLLLCLLQLGLFAKEKDYQEAVTNVLADEFYNPKNQFWFQVDLIYAKAREQSVVATNKKSPLASTTDFTKARLTHPHFEWDFGYRVGLGHLIMAHRKSATDIGLQWMHYHTTAEQNKAADSKQGMFPIWAHDVPRGEYVTQSDLDWRLTIDMLDLAFTYSYHPRKRFEMKSFAGLRSGWIKQRMGIDYKGGFFLFELANGMSVAGPDDISLKNNFWGLGPIIGLGPRYILGHGIRLYVDGAISGLCGYYSLHQREKYLETTRFYSSKHPIKFRWIADLGAGAYWKTFLYKTSYPFVLKLGWEYHIFFDQMQLKDDEFDLVPHNRDLELQGITLSASLDF